MTHGEWKEHVIDAIKKITKRTVSIATDNTEENRAKCHQQRQSRLFTLPGELRNVIFEYATLPYDDAECTYASTAYYYRPGHTARHIASTGLLRTCRLAWLEANQLPMRQTVHCFWLQGDDYRRPRYLDKLKPKEATGDDESRMMRFIDRLTPNNRKNLETMQLFTQVYWLQDRMHDYIWKLLGSCYVCPEVLNITIKHTDWFYWERDEVLRLQESCFEELLRYPALSRLREIRLELETLESKMHQLRPIVEKMRGMYDLLERTDHFGDWVQVELQDPPPEWTWSGPTNPGGRMRRPYRNLEKLDYRVVTLVWKTNYVSFRLPSRGPMTGFEDDCVNLAHSPGPDLPIFSINRVDSNSNAVQIGVDGNADVDIPQNGLVNSKEEVALPGDMQTALCDNISTSSAQDDSVQDASTMPSAEMAWLRMWAQEDSLLKFASDPVLTR